MASTVCKKCGNYMLEGVTSKEIDVSMEFIERIQRLNKAPALNVQLVEHLTRDQLSGVRNVMP